MVIVATVMVRLEELVGVEIEVLTGEKVEEVI